MIGPTLLASISIESANASRSALRWHCIRSSLKAGDQLDVYDSAFFAAQHVHFSDIDDC